MPGTNASLLGVRSCLASDKLTSNTVYFRTRKYFGQDDLFAYFEHLVEENKRPTLEELEKAARDLHRAYSSTSGLHWALSEPSAHVHHEGLWRPEAGSPWKSPEGQSSADGDSLLVVGDPVLAHSIAFM